MAEAQGTEYYRKKRMEPDLTFSLETCGFLRSGLDLKINITLNLPELQIKISVGIFESLFIDYWTNFVFRLSRLFNGNL